MRIINIVGFLPFLKLYFEKQSVIPFIVVVNGILCHNDGTSFMFRLYDILINLILLSHFLYHHFRKVRLLILLAIFIFCFNFYCFDVKKYYDRIYSDIIHMVGVQYLLYRGLRKVLK